MQDLSTRNYAHIGDAVWELYVREYTIYQTQNSKLLHKITTDRVKMDFQADLFEFIKSELTDEELELARRARNANIPVSRRNNQAEYRLATAFEALIGFWYLNDKPRLEYFYEKFREKIVVEQV